MKKEKTMAIININGVKKTITDNADITIHSDSVFVNGNDLSGKVNKGMKITIEGNVRSIDCQGSLSVTGDVYGNIRTNGSTNINGNVVGNVEASGNCSCKNISGDVSCNGKLVVGRKL